MASQSPLNIPHADCVYRDGQWVKPSTSDTFAILNCATEEVVAHAAKAHEADVNAAVASARQAFDHGPWPHMTPVERAAYLEKIAKRIEALQDDFARNWSIETGALYHSIAKPLLGAIMGAAFRQFIEMAHTYPFIEPTRPMSGLQGWRVREPVGVTAIVIPWNAPGILLANKLAPALLAGCTVIIKNSPETPSTGHLLAQICHEVGVPPGVVNVLTADRDVSETLVRHPGVDKISFTGSAATGRRIGAIAAERIARVTLELGGKSPAVILDDYDVEAAAKAIAAPYYRFLSGQVCSSLTRIIVPRAKHDAMVEALSAVARDVVVGDPMQATSTMGPLTSERQRGVVERMVAQGVSEGAQLATGGQRPKQCERGFYFEPTVFGKVDNNYEIAQKEIFGPVISVIPADSEQHAIDIANDTIYGLNAVVFTNDNERAMHTARRLRAGTVGHNGDRGDFSVGFGGFKQSGIGREGGVEGLAAFLESKSVVIDQKAT